MTPELETQTEIRKTSHRWIDISVALCALVVSITSLCVAVLHGHTMERMADANARLVAANSWPLLQRFSSDVDATGQRIVSLMVANSGVGPAKVETVELFWKDRPFRTFEELLAACCQTTSGSAEKAPASAAAAGASPASAGSFQEMIQTSSLVGTVMRAGESRSILVIPRTAQNEPVTSAFSAVWGDLKTRVCYCSVFDECWISDLRTMHPEASAQCPKPEVMFVVN